MKLISKAAMFGLDARIALAIFGALSVISGAALFSAIQNAQTERYWQTFREIIKASEAYYLDNGKALPLYSTTNTLYGSDLVENRESLSTWQGPYISGAKAGTYSIRNSFTKEFSADVYLMIILAEVSTWTSASFDACTSGSVDCAEWIALSSPANGHKETKAIFAQLDEKIDNGDGAKAGNVRLQDDTTAVFVFIKGIPRKRVI